MSQVLETLLVELKADVKGLQGSLNTAIRDVRTFESQSNQITTSVGNMFARLRTQVLAFASVWAAFRVGKSFVDAGVQMQSLTAKMGAATGSANITAESLAFVRSEAQRLGLDFRSIADGFASFAASALRSGLTFQETKDIFTGVSEAATGMRLSAERTSLVFIALSQMASKGTVSMEELKQQLGESLPGALQVFSKAMGKGNAEFIKMVENGQVTTRDLIKLGQGLKREFGAAAEEAATGAQAAFNRLGNALFELQAKIAESGFLDAVTNSVKELTKQLNDPATVEGMKAFAEYLGDIVSVAAKASAALGNVLSHFRDRQLAFKELSGGNNMAFIPEAQIAERVEAIRLRRQVVNAPYSPTSTPGPDGGLLAGSTGSGLLSGGLGGDKGSTGGYTLGKSSPPGVSAAAQRAADARAALRQRVMQQSSGLISETDPNKVDAAEAMASLEKRHQEEQDLLEKALNKKAVTQEEFNEQSLKVELDYQSRLAELRKQYRDAFLSDEQAAAEGFLGVQVDYQDKSVKEQGQSFRSSIQQAAQHNKAFFELEKAASLAQALLSARQSIVDAYKFGNALGGPPLGAAFAGVAAAAQAANIAAIASTSFGGGGGVSSAGAGGAGGGGGGPGDTSSSSSSGDLAEAPTKMVRVELHGDPDGFYSINTMRKIIEGLNDALAGGSRLNVVTVS
ncbi:tape measure domain-containing protein [Bradyrhizobium sp. LB8.2]|uniref:tape measure protein n=1 Tax=unclassified Bradyrhizobium TaxID=2631580 RepID=UPI0033950093